MGEGEGCRQDLKMNDLKINFPIKSFALSLAFIMKFTATRKSPNNVGDYATIQ